MPAPSPDPPGPAGCVSLDPRGPSPLPPPISDDLSHCHGKNENEQAGVPVSPALNFTYRGPQGVEERQDELDG